MAKFLLCFLGVAAIALGLSMEACTASTVYTVGDTAGWDISSNIESWVQDKTFEVGDSLLFQYSSTHSVNEVTKASYDRCNVTKYISSSNSGNTTIPLTSPGEKYFICGNRLHCLGGMKLQITVNENQAPASAPASAMGPAGEAPSMLPRPSTKNNRPFVSAGVIHGGRDSLVYVFLCGIIATVLSVSLI